MKALEQRRVGGRQKGTGEQPAGRRRCARERGACAPYMLPFIVSVLYSFERWSDDGVRYGGAFARRTQPNLC